MTLSQAPIRSWGLTTYSRRDWDARRPTGGTRAGRWHAFQDSNPGGGSGAGGVTLLALCGRVVSIGVQDWHNGQDVPQWPRQVRYALDPYMTAKARRRLVCQDCARRQVEGEL